MIFWWWNLFDIFLKLMNQKLIQLVSASYLLLKILFFPFYRIIHCFFFLFAFPVTFFLSPFAFSPFGLHCVLLYSLVFFNIFQLRFMRLQHPRFHFYLFVSIGFSHLSRWHLCYREMIFFTIFYWFSNCEGTLCKTWSFGVLFHCNFLLFTEAY